MPRNNSRRRALKRHIMIHKAVLGQLGILCSLTTIVGVGVDADAAAGREYTRHLDIFRVHEADEVFHYLVHAVFMKVAVVSETEKI